MEDMSIVNEVNRLKPHLQKGVSLTEALIFSVGV